MEKKEEFNQQMETFSESDGEHSENILDEWDSDDGICSSRSPTKTCKRIGKMILLLICFFGLIILFSIGIMILFDHIFNNKGHLEVTTHLEITTHEEGLIDVEITTEKNTCEIPHGEVMKFDPEIPQLRFEPQIDDNNTLIRCTYDSSGTRPYVKKINTVIKSIKSISSNSQDCHDNVTRNMEKPCRFAMSQLGKSCMKKRQYGFIDCRICVALTLNKVIDWQPIAYDNESVPLEIRDRYNDKAVTVSCRGVNPPDVGNLGPVSYYPAGFHFKYFPYQQQEGYNAPLVMVHFKKPSRFTYISVECKAWAKNIDHSKNEGITTFELFLE